MHSLPPHTSPQVVSVVAHEATGIHADRHIVPATRRQLVCRQVAGEDSGCYVTPCQNSAKLINVLQKLKIDYAKLRPTHKQAARSQQPQ